MIMKEIIISGGQTWNFVISSFAISSPLLQSLSPLLQSLSSLLFTIYILPGILFSTQSAANLDILEDKNCTICREDKYCQRGDINCKEEITKKKKMKKDKIKIKIWSPSC